MAQKLGSTLQSRAARRKKLSTRAHTVPKFYLRGFVALEAQDSRDPFVWIASLTTGEIKLRSPKNISIERRLYDGPGGLAEPDATIEAHLAKIESAASVAIRRFAAAKIGEGGVIPPEISRFLAWQAARTPGWMELEQQWANEPWFDREHDVVEPPPLGFPETGNRQRPMCLEDPNTGARREVITEEELRAYLKQGWKWILRRDDRLELLHMQAWYFQVRHFPRLSWVRLQPPDNEFFITSDRGVAWIVDGYADAPPAALRDPKAEIVAPLTRTLALVGRHRRDTLNVTPREVNRFVACAASDWIAGPTSDAVRQALADRRSALLH
jgi:Protein of unknown function (DUF4238)